MISHAFLMAVMAAGPSAFAQTKSTSVLSKDVSGRLTGSSLTFSLQAHAPCDQTQALIPDGTQLVSQPFTLVVDGSGRGTFDGAALVVGPDGKTILRAFLRGVAGIGTSDCAAPGHLEGLIEGSAPLNWEVGGARAGIVPFGPTILRARFVADEVREAASPVPLYRGRIDGLLNWPSIPPPVTDRITVAPDRRAYDVKDPVIAYVKNGSGTAIQVLDEESYCSIVKLEKQTSGGWSIVAGCPLDRVSLPTVIPAGTALEVRLPPDPSTPATKEPGLYRLEVTYTSLNPGASVAENAVTVESAPFTVAGVPVPLPGPNRVSITVDRSGYRSEDPILATVTNDTDQTLQTYDHRSYCSVLGLQRQGPEGWSEVAPCLLLSPTRQVRIERHSSLKVGLPPEGVAHRHPGGTYRVDVTFVVLDSNGNPIPTFAPLAVDSLPFAVYDTRSASSEAAR